MKLWDKGQSTHADINTFTVGRDREFDRLLAAFDLQGTRAHVIMLERVGLLSSEELKQLLPQIDAISTQVDQGKFVIEKEVEDVHSQIELMLTRSLGELGKKIHSGRSRNDQVMVDLRLFFRHMLGELDKQLTQVFNHFLTRAQETSAMLMPGYTHTQAAMPSSFGLWFSCFAESLVDDRRLLKCVGEINNQNPLGSAAGYGSSFPLDRDLTTELLDFESTVVNSMYAQMGRGKTEQLLAYALANLAGTINKFASDVILFNSQNFGFLKLPEPFTTGSSIMPHKKNPDVFELIRGKSNLLRGLPNQIELLRGNLTSGYHRDFQLLKEVLFPAFQEMHSILEMLVLVLPELEVAQDLMSDERYRLTYSVEVVNELVRSGMPFRDAYKEVARRIENGTLEIPKTLNHSHLGSIGNLGLNRIREKWAFLD